jgi:hypothetical protein
VCDSICVKRDVIRLTYKKRSVEFRKGSKWTEPRVNSCANSSTLIRQKMDPIASHRIAPGRPTNSHLTSTNRSIPSSSNALFHQGRTSLSPNSSQPRDPVPDDLRNVTYVQARTKAVPPSLVQTSGPSSPRGPRAPAEDNLGFDLSKQLGRARPRSPESSGSLPKTQSKRHVPYQSASESDRCEMPISIDLTKRPNVHMDDRTSCRPLPRDRRPAAR